MPRACSDCRQTIRLVPTARGRQMPLDVAPTPDGNVEVVDGRAYVLKSVELRLARQDGTELWMPHFATCPARLARQAVKKIDADTGMQQGTLL